MLRTSRHERQVGANSPGLIAPCRKGWCSVTDTNGNELVAQNTDEPFVPASVTKIVTAWLAMEVLGGDYRFKTRFNFRVTKSGHGASATTISSSLPT